MLCPKKKKQTVGIIFPSSVGATVEERAYTENLCVSNLERLGFDAYFPKNTFADPQNIPNFGPSGTYCNTPENRAQQIIKMMHNDSLDIIWAGSGGNGSNQVVELLEQYFVNPKKYASTYPGVPDILPTHKPTFVGYSDFSELSHLLIRQGFPVYYSATLDSFCTEEKDPLKRTAQMLQKADEENPENLTETLSGLIPLNDLARKNSIIEGHLIPTLLNSTSTSIRTESQLSPMDGAIFAVEMKGSNDEFLSLLSQAKESGLLDDVSAIVIASRENDGRSKEVGHKTTQEIITKLGINKPVYYMSDLEQSFGHIGPDINPLPTLAKCRIDGDKLIMASCPSQKIMEQYKRQPITPQVRNFKTPATDTVYATDFELYQMVGTDRELGLSGKHLTIATQGAIQPYTHRYLQNAKVRGDLANVKSITIGVQTVGTKEDITPCLSTCFGPAYAATKVGEQTEGINTTKYLVSRKSNSNIIEADLTNLKNQLESIGCKPNQIPKDSPNWEINLTKEQEQVFFNRINDEQIEYTRNQINYIGLDTEVNFKNISESAYKEIESGFQKDYQQKKSSDPERLCAAASNSESQIKEGLPKTLDTQVKQGSAIKPFELPQTTKEMKDPSRL